MDREDFPALFRSSDELSNQCQAEFFTALRLHLIALLVAAGLSVLNYPEWYAAAIQTFALLVALACSVYLATIRPERLWYRARAVAESIKTMSWRYITRAEPFNLDDTTARTQFIERLREIVAVNRAVSEKLTIDLDKSQVTHRMGQLRAQALDERMSMYLSKRVSDQLTWYAAKAAHNGKISKRFFVALIATNSIAVILAVLRVKFPAASYWPTDIFVTLAAALLTWLQARRYSELSSSYALAAHEIGFIHDQSAQIVGDETKFSQFVGDAENAFSREHTQWTARKDT